MLASLLFRIFGLDFCFFLLRVLCLFSLLYFSQCHEGRATNVSGYTSSIKTG